MRGADGIYAGFSVITRSRHAFASLIDDDLRRLRRRGLID
jgi:hypothetical protein